MATPGEVIYATAGVLEIPSVTVATYYRALRERGLVTKGGRGRSAPSLTALDGTRLVVALLSSDTAKQAPDRAMDICSLVPHEVSLGGKAALLEAVRALTFEEALEKLLTETGTLESLMGTADKSSFRLSVVGERAQAHIRVAGSCIPYGADGGVAGSEPRGMVVERSIGWREVADLSRVLWQ